jgi:hypothetical protein
MYLEVTGAFGVNFRATRDADDLDALADRLDAAVAGSKRDGVVMELRP